MELIFLKPTTPSQRQLILCNKKHLLKKPFLKFKTKGSKNSSGRNNQGKITVRHKGNGHKQKYRKIIFNRSFKSFGIVSSIEYDPNRSSNIASIFDFSKKKFYYIIAPLFLKVGTIIQSGSKTNKYLLGNSLRLSKIPVGSFIHNISLKFNKDAKIARSAGTYCLIEEKILNYAILKLPSNKHKYVRLNNYATAGIVSNELNFVLQKGKAGRSRWLNIRPTVRGVAMNPVDHPNGGGEGKKSGKGKTPWGKKN
jgi:large subunit ribosomal protein L2